MTTKATSKPPATHIRFTERINAMLHEASERTGLPQSELVRTATSIGLRYLAEIDYDIDGAIYEKAQKSIQSKLSSESEQMHPAIKQHVG